MGQVVDTETAVEFMKETLERVDVDELGRIAAEVEQKAVTFAARLSPQALAVLSHDDFAALLTGIFSTRGTFRQALMRCEWPLLRERMLALVHGGEPVEQRLQTFADHLGADGFAENLRIDFATELLHFSAPERHWLWTRWMWDPRTRTGALPLVTTAAYDLGDGRAGETYLKVGKAVAFVHEVGEAAGFQRISRTVFGTDVFLACVYTIYTYTVLRMRMTKEFNKVVPQLAEFVRRLLGVHRKTGPTGPAGTVAAPLST